MNDLICREPTPAALIPFDDIVRMGNVMAHSKLFGIQSEQQAIALMLLCQSENLHPATAMRDYHLIQGRPALKADAMLARFQAAGGKVKWGRYEDDGVSGTFTHPSGDSITIEWTPQRVSKARISNEMHSKYPRQMLKARCISEGIRAIYPGVLSGLYSPEEVLDMDKPADPPASVSAAARLKAKINESLIKSGAMPAVITDPPADMDELTGEITDPIADLLLAIGECQTREELETHRAAVAGLKNGLKRRAIAAWKAAETALPSASA